MIMPGVSELRGHAGLARFERGDDRLVHFLGEVVSFLVEAVDAALGLVHGFEAEVVAARDVLLVPEREIAQVVFLEQAEESCAPSFAEAGGYRGVTWCQRAVSSVWRAAMAGTSKFMTVGKLSWTKQPRTQACARCA